MNKLTQQMKEPNAGVETRTPERIAFEIWYNCNVFDLEESPIGSRDCCLMWKAWKARAEKADESDPDTIARYTSNFDGSDE